MTEQNGETKKSGVNAENNSIAVGNISAGGDISGNIHIGNVMGYTSEQVAVLITHIQSTFQPKPFDGRSPYKGLDVFEEEDAELFFGREKLVDDLISRVKDSRTVFVTGPSGSGKSSLVRAGLIHALKQGAIKGSERWLYATMKPGRDPLEALANAFSRLKSPELGNYFRQHVDQVKVVHECVEAALSENKNQRFVLFIDQFEEVFTQINNEEERFAFLNLLTHAATVESGRVIILFSMRSDFVSNCATYPQLNELLSKQFRQIGAMQPEELVSAIAQPALRVGLRIDPDLIAQIINEMKGEPGALPLMQFALKDLFDSQQEKSGVIALTLNDYLQRGGIHKALERHADDSFSKLSKSEQELARSIFSGLIEIGRGTQDTKRTALFDELVPANTKATEVEAIVQKLADARLITTDEQAGKETVTISHEKLIDAWPWLKKLVNENRDVIALQNEITSDAKEWDGHKRDSSYLYTGGRLANVHEQVNAKKLVLNGTASDFVDTGLVRQKRRRIALVSGISVIFVLLIAAVIVFARLTKEAQKQSQIAQEQSQIAQARADELKNLAIVEQANNAIQDHNPDLAIALAIHTVKGENPPEKAYASLLDAAYIHLSRNSYTVCQQSGDESAWVTAVDISADNRTVAIGCSSNDMSKVYILDLFTDNIEAEWFYSAWLYDLAFSPDGKSILTGYSDRKAILWSRDGVLIHALENHDGKVSAVTFSPDGTLALTGSYDKSINLWDIATGKLLGKQSNLTGKITSLEFSPKGGKAVFGDDDGNVSVWDYEKDRIYYSIFSEKHSSFVLSAGFSSDGLKIISSSADSTIAIWSFGDYLSRERVLDISKSYPGIWVKSVEYFQDDTKMLTALSNGLILLWDVRSMQVIQILEGHLAEIDRLSISSDETFAISGARDGTIRLWDLEPFKSQIIISDNGYETNSIILNGDNSHLFGGTANGYVNIWNIKSSKLMSSWQPYPETVSIPEITLSPDETSLITIGTNGTAILWDIASHKSIWQFSKPGDNARSVDINDEGTQAILGYVSGELTLIDLKTGQLTCTLTGHTNAVNSVRFSPDGKFAASGSNDYTVILWNILTCQKEKVLYEHDGWVMALKFSPNGKIIASASADSTIILWNLDTQQQLYRLQLPNIGVNPGLDAFVLSIDFSADGHLLSSGYANGNVAIWSVTNGILLRKYISSPAKTCQYGVRCYWVLSTKFSPSGDTLWISMSDGQILAWPLIPAFNSLELQEWLTKNRYIRELTEKEREAYEIRE
ncbi:MAG: AAA family ATPase [Anaerolineales bacterium]|nr:AAA family ATPase [Anaerolineales bacterium]